MGGMFRAPISVQREVKSLVKTHEESCRNSVGELDRDELKIQVGDSLMQEGGAVWDELCRHAVLIAVNAMVDETIRKDRIPLKRNRQQTFLVADPNAEGGVREITAVRLQRAIVQVPTVDGKAVDREFLSLNKDEVFALLNGLRREQAARQDYIDEVEAIYLQMCLMSGDVRVRDVVQEVA